MRSDRARHCSPADVSSEPFFRSRKGEKRFIGLSDLMRLHDKMFWYQWKPPQSTRTVPCIPKQEREKSDNRVVYCRSLISQFPNSLSGCIGCNFFTTRARMHAFAKCNCIAACIPQLCILTAYELQLMLQSFCEAYFK